MKKSKFKTSSEERLLNVCLLVAGVAAAALLAFAAIFLSRKLGVMSLRDRLGRYPEIYYSIALGALCAGAFALGMAALSGLGALFTLCRLRFGRILERVGLFSLALVFAVGAAAAELALPKITDKLVPDQLLGADDPATLALLIHGAAIILVLAAASNVLCALCLRKSAFGKRSVPLMIVSSLTACCVLALYLVLYHRFLRMGQLYSYTLSKALSPFADRLKYYLEPQLFGYVKKALSSPDAQTFEFAKYIAFVPALFYAVFAMFGRERSRRDRGVCTLIASLLLFFAAFCALKEFTALMARYELYSKRISTFTLLRNPVTALCLIGMGCMLLTRFKRPFVGGFALILCGINIWQMRTSTMPIVLRSFDTAFETALPIAYIAFWAALAVCCGLGMLLKKGIALWIVAGVTAFLALVPLLAAALYYFRPLDEGMNNFKYIVEFRPAPESWEILLAQYLLPSLGCALAALGCGVEVRKKAR